MDVATTSPASAGPLRWLDRRAMHTTWRLWLYEAAAIGLFMVSALLCTVALEHPSSPLRAALPGPVVRRVVMGAAMGLTAAALIYSPMGVRSGAHMNPAVTLAFLRLGRIGRGDAVAYVVAQCLGATAATAAAAAWLGALASDPAVDFVVTRPGSAGVAAAAGGEFVVAFATLSVVLLVSSRPATMPYTGLVAGLIVMANIVIEAPLSGMSMNPARSLGPAVVAGQFPDFWIYVVMPVAGMQCAAALHAAIGSRGCARLHHPAHVRCAFCGA